MSDWTVPPIPADQQPPGPISPPPPDQIQPTDPGWSAFVRKEADKTGLKVPPDCSVSLEVVVTGCSGVRPGAGAVSGLHPLGPPLPQDAHAKIGAIQSDRLRALRSAFRESAAELFHETRRPADNRSCRSLRWDGHARTQDRRHGRDLQEEDEGEKDASRLSGCNAGFDPASGRR